MSQRRREKQNQELKGPASTQGALVVPMNTASSSEIRDEILSPVEQAPSCLTPYGRGSTENHPFTPHLGYQIKYMLPR